MSTGSKQGRHCRICGCVPALTEEGSCHACMNHSGPHQEYGQFNARCITCWTDMWRAIPTSLFISAWRVASRLGRRSSGRLP